MSQTAASFLDYDGFLEKFEAKKTTDDCYTPAPIIDAVTRWACKEYHIDPAATRILRPFRPGGDYESEDYTGAVVIDNPPFSILSRIVDFYNALRVPFLLFGPMLTSFGLLDRKPLAAIVVSTQIEYENGAKVATAYLTNLEPDTIIRAAPDLDQALKEAAVKVKEIKRTETPPPTYRFPENIAIASHLATLARYGIPFTVPRHSGQVIKALRSQRAAGKAIFGAGVLLSTAKAREAAEKARQAAEKARLEALARAIVWPLSLEEELAIQALDRREAANPSHADK